MKSRTVDTVTSDEEHIRLRIFDGDLPTDEAGKEKVRMLEWAVHRAEARVVEFLDRAWRAERALSVMVATTPKIDFTARADRARSQKARKK